MEKLKYLGVVFTSDERQDQELHVRSGKACNASFAPFSRLKTGAIKKGKTLGVKSIFLPILTYGHESWVMTKRMRSQMQASEIRFFRRIKSVTVKHRNTANGQSLDMEWLLLRIDTSLHRPDGRVVDVLGF